MALTANGIGSGLDIDGLVGQLMAVEKRPLATMGTKEASYQAKISAFGQLKGALAMLQSAADGLKDPAIFTATKATAGTDAAFTTASSSTAVNGNYSLEVAQLAKVQRVATSSTSEYVPVAGDLTIDFGSMAGGTFAADASRSKTLAFAGGTLEELRDAINDGDLGIKASVINNGAAKQLVLTGATTGAAEVFRLSGTVGLAYNPETPGSASDPTYQVQAAQDAKLTVDGIAITRSSNTVGDAIEGVTLTLNKESPGVISNLSVANDYAGARSAIDAFVKAYNDVNNTIKGLTAFNAETRQASTLTGDSTARGIHNRIRTLAGGVLSDLGATSRLSDIGISFKPDGSLAVDSGKLDAAIRDPEKNVGSFFGCVGSVQGFADTFSSVIGDFIGSTGLIAGRTDGINASVRTIAKQRAALTVRLELVEKRYRAQFTALDSAMASMTQTSNYLAQQLANLPRFNER